MKGLPSPTSPVAVVGRKPSHAGARRCLVVARGKEGRQEGIGEIRVIDHVEEVGAELHLQPLVNRRVLIERNVPLLEGGPQECIAPFRARVLGSRDARALRYVQGTLKADRLATVGEAASRVGIPIRSGRGKYSPVPSQSPL